MKYLIFSFLLTLPFIVVSQCEYDKDVIDDFTGSKVILTKKTDLVHGSWDNPVEFSLGFTESEVEDDPDAIVLALNLTNLRLGCINDESRAYLKFTDDSVLRLMNQGKINCNDYQLSFIALITNDQLSDLASKELTKMRIVGTEGTKDLKVDRPFHMTKAAKCLQIGIKK